MQNANCKLAIDRTVGGVWMWQWRTAQFAICILQFAICNAALACNVPVCRYALEHWPADSYQVFVYQRGPLAGEEQEALALLEKAHEQHTLNMDLQVVDLADNAQPEPAVLHLPPAAELPWLVVRYPAVARVHGEVWSGRLSRDAVAALLDSPARRELTRLLVQGDAAVWLFLKSGDADRDAALRRLLQRQFRRLQGTLKMAGAEEEKAAGKEQPGPV